MQQAYVSVYFGTVLRDAVGNLNEQYNETTHLISTLNVMQKSYKQSYKVSYEVKKASPGTVALLLLLCVCVCVCAHACVFFVYNSCRKIDSACLFEKWAWWPMVFHRLTASKCHRDGVFLHSTPTDCTVKMSSVGHKQEKSVIFGSSVSFKSGEWKDYYTYLSACK